MQALEQAAAYNSDVETEHVDDSASEFIHPEDKTADEVIACVSKQPRFTLSADTQNTIIFSQILNHQKTEDDLG